MFDGRLVELRGKWLNGAWGRLSRRDVWLYREPERWLRAREGTGDAPFRELGWQFENEAEARGMVERLMGDGGE